MKIIVFYSWQSDLPNSTNRGFIEKALQAAVNDIRDYSSIAVEPVIDRDTAGVPGSPDIADTILAKIDQSHVFVGDISIINPNSGERKTPNPNVLIELGYATKTLGHQSIVLVQNVAFGPPEQLPFDLRMKRILTYTSMKEEKDRSSSRKELQRKLKNSLALIIQDIDEKESRIESDVVKDNYPLDVEINYKDLNIWPERHDYNLIIHLINKGTESITSYHVDIEFPSELIEKPENNPYIVNDRCTISHSFFRFTDRNLRKEIFPGDKIPIPSVRYFVDEHIFGKRNELLYEKVKVTAYVSGFPPKVVEKSMKELQKF